MVKVRLVMALATAGGRHSRKRPFLSPIPSLLTGQERPESENRAPHKLFVLLDLAQFPLLN
ncbi:hypothetical protein ROLI_040080 [Roseobacter fucihabitans]|uniref:Uncharacterized protein n=1 Tax=Roseobacter fucihabitans TaxID=1537242 RepID=A0ABZ2BYS7_9RHOB|nr:hypothetical protein [Roseobacter litoralis]